MPRNQEFFLRAFYRPSPIPNTLCQLKKTTVATIEEQARAIFEPIPLDRNYRFDLPAYTREIFIPVSEQGELNGFLFEKPGNTLLMVYFQGNARNLQNFLDNHSMVLDWGYNVLVTDYRGFGKSTGPLNGQSQMYADADQILDYALSLGYGLEHIILYGYSMGSAMACYLASTRKAKALVLESAYSSLPEVFVDNDLPSYELNNQERAKSIGIPTLIIHGDQDGIITPDHAHRIYRNLLSSRKKLTILMGGGHGDLRARSEYAFIVTDFIQQHA